MLQINPITPGGNSMPKQKENQTEGEALEWLSAMMRRAREEGPFSEPHELTPSLADVLLTLNPDNRPARTTIMRRLITDIREGRYKLNGQPIIVADDGNMNDGQHRCGAVAETRIPIMTFFTFGVTRESRSTVDTGTARSGADFLSMAGVTDAHCKTAVASLLFQWDNNQTIKQNVENRPTTAQGQAKFFAHREEIEDAALLVSRGGYSIFGSRSLAAFVLVVLRRIDEEKANEFIVAVRDGTGLQASDPRYVVRERFRTDRSRLGPTSAKIELLFRAWNLWREGKQVRSVPLINNIPVPK